MTQSFRATRPSITGRPTTLPRSARGRPSSPCYVASATASRRPLTLAAVPSPSRCPAGLHGGAQGLHDDVGSPRQHGHQGQRRSWTHDPHTALQQRPGSEKPEMTAILTSLIARRRWRASRRASRSTPRVSAPPSTAAGLTPSMARK